MLLPFVLLSAIVQPPPFHAQIDHFVIAIRSLAEGVAAFEKLTGVKPVAGGKHPDRGTENALVSLGSGTYLEIIAPQKGAKLTPLDEPMTELTDLTVIAWAVSVSDATQARDRLLKAGTTPSPVTPGSRVTPAGTTLEWTTFGLMSPQIDVAPFFIAWGAGTKHPSTTSPKGCTLSKVLVRDAAAADLTRVLDTLGVKGAEVTTAPTAINVLLECPKGPVTLKTRD